jgi:hypothetical protein
VVRGTWNQRWADSVHFRNLRMAAVIGKDLLRSQCARTRVDSPAGTGTQTLQSADQYR